MATADGFRSAGNEEDIDSDVDGEEADSETAGNWKLYLLNTVLIKSTYNMYVF